jgi:hypothetical protein
VPTLVQIDLGYNIVEDPIEVHDLHETSLFLHHPL